VFPKWGFVVMAFARGAAGVISTLKIAQSKAKRAGGEGNGLDLLVCQSLVVSLIIMANVAATCWNGVVLVDSGQRIVLLKGLNAFSKVKRLVTTAVVVPNAVGSVSIMLPRLSIAEVVVKPVARQTLPGVVKMPPVILPFVSRDLLMPTG